MTSRTEPRIWVDHDGTGTLRPLRDPAAVGPPRGDIEDPPIRGHSDYNLDPTFDQVTRAAAQRLRDMGAVAP